MHKVEALEIWFYLIIYMPIEWSEKDIFWI